MSNIPLSPATFDNYKKNIIVMINNIKFDDLDPHFQMSLENGIKMGNHANDCNVCNIYHYLMAIIIDTHRKQSGK